MFPIVWTKMSDQSGNISEEKVTETKKEENTSIEL